MTARQHVLCAAVLLGAVCAVYAGHVWSAGWVYEDGRYLTSPAESLWHTRSLVRLSWRVAPTPGTAHALSLGLHLMAVAGVWTLIRGLGASDLGTWTATAMFALHPIQVEPVAYAAARGELIAAIGVMLACNGVLWMRGWPAVGIGMGGVIIGLAGKESALIVLGLLPLVRRRWSLAVTLTGLTSVVVWVVGAGLAANFRSLAPSAWQWVLIQATAAYRLIAMSLVPRGQTVDFDYGLVTVTMRYLSVVVLVALASIAWMMRSVRPLAAMGLTWMLMVIVPRLLVPTPQSVLNEHQWYLAMVGVALIASDVVMMAEARIRESEARWSA